MNKSCNGCAHASSESPSIPSGEIACVLCSRNPNYDEVLAYKIINSIKERFRKPLFNINPPIDMYISLKRLELHLSGTPIITGSV